MDELDQNDQDDSDRTDAEWAKLRRTRKEKEKAEQEAQKARRELAFLKAGLNTDDPKTSYFVKGYEGEVTTEAIRKAAMEAGFLEAPPEEPVDQQTLDATGRVASASSGAGVVSAKFDAGELSKAYDEGGMDALNEMLRSAGAVVTDVQ